MPPLSVLLVDDEPLYLNLTQERFRGDPRVTIVGAATSGEEALAVAEQLRPDVAVLDVLLPGLNGVETARRRRAQLPSLRIVLASADPSFGEDLAPSGAVGFVDKKRLSPDGLLAALGERRG